MLAFARRQDLKPARVDVAALVRGMVELVQRTLGPAWALQLDFPATLPPVLADANQLEMALLNLAVNARDAMPQGGPIRISAEQSAVAADNAQGLAAGGYIVLSVTDTGEGMDADTLLRATEPFFTTKGVGKGTGLGLSMIHGLAKQLNGNFVLHSAPGKGTVACLWLPVIENDVAAVAPALPETEAVTTRALKILAVDDDVLIRMNIAAMLEDMGHEVIEAGSGDVALALLHEHPDIELLITDQAMPKMTGLELIGQVTSARADLPLILATGYGELPTSLSPRVVKLDKPFTERQLARAVDAAIAFVAKCEN